MKQTHLFLTFRETLRVRNIIFEQGESIIALYLGGGDTLRVMWEGEIFEVPSRLVRQEIVLW